MPSDSRRKTTFELLCWSSRIASQAVRRDLRRQCRPLPQNLSTANSICWRIQMKMQRPIALPAGCLVLCLMLFAHSAYADCSGSSPNLTATTWADIESCYASAVDGDKINFSGTLTGNSLITLVGSKYVHIKGS